ncbi:LysR family transcriptional regulator [Lentilitoribacter sp. EG35]|uniref:LysR family transcriptional regulator n=1 Tax=Lentilitoribacter sp. EG35 TaxID=3234192 RepID=UPI00345FD379
MKQWDDIKIFLALVDAGTIRGAADLLELTHVTVTRRIRAFENEIGTILFERLPTGHVLTDAGRSILPLAKATEANVFDLERRVQSIDRKLDGTVTLSLPEAIATILIAPALQDFRELYPQISLKILLSNKLVNLNTHETDIALRLTKNPPDSAYGRCIAKSPLCVYAASSYLAVRPSPDTWVGFDYDPAHQLAGDVDVSIQANGLLAMAELLAAGLGVGVLPCFVGDNHAGLQRIDSTKPKPDLDLWLLVHKDLRTVPRVRAVADFIAERLIRIRPSIEGTE